MHAPLPIDRPLRLMVVVGTRPEAIKLAPVIRACREQPDDFEPLVCFTGQHRELVEPVAKYFGIVPDIDLHAMQPGQSLATLTSRCLEGIDGAIEHYQPDYVLAQGDTTSVLAASLAAFYRRVPFVHVEAGLRTGDLQAPWPEEFNRRAVSITAALHCAPTEQARQNLLDEQCDPQRVIITGNTVVDALLWTRDRERARDEHWRRRHPLLGDQPLVLITGHRRENFGPRFEEVTAAIAELAAAFPQTEFVYPVHLNPQAREPAFRHLAGRANVHLIEPVPYPEFVWLMDRATLIITDSGGIQEEAPSLGTPVLVTRDTTERPEAVAAGATLLVGASRERLIAESTRLLTDASAYRRCQVAANPYGDGRAAERILEHLHTGGLFRNPRPGAQHTEYV